MRHDHPVDDWYNDLPTVFLGGEWGRTSRAGGPAERFRPKKGRRETRKRGFVSASGGWEGVPGNGCVGVRFEVFFFARVTSVRKVDVCIADVEDNIVDSFTVVLTKFLASFLKRTSLDHERGKRVSEVRFFFFPRAAGAGCHAVAVRHAPLHSSLFLSLSLSLSLSLDRSSSVSFLAFRVLCRVCAFFRLECYCLYLAGNRRDWREEREKEG